MNTANKSTATIFRHRLIPAFWLTTINTKIKAAIFLSIISLCSLLTYSHDTQVTKTGKEIFEKNCTGCHGNDGQKGKWGAKDLSKSRLADADIVTIVTRGKRIMPSWKKALTPEEIQSVIGYVKELRK